MKWRESWVRKRERIEWGERDDEGRLETKICKTLPSYSIFNSLRILSIAQDLQKVVYLRIFF